MTIPNRASDITMEKQSFLEEKKKTKDYVSGITQSP